MADGEGQFLTVLRGEKCRRGDAQRGITLVRRYAQHPGRRHGRNAPLDGQQLQKHVAGSVRIGAVDGNGAFLHAQGKAAARLLIGGKIAVVIVENLRVVKIPATAAMIHQLVGNLYPADNIEGEIHRGIIGGEGVRIKGNALDQRIAAIAGILACIVGEKRIFAVFRVCAHSGCAMVAQQVPAQLGQGDLTVPVIVSGKVSLGRNGPHQCAGKISCAGQALALDIAGPEPAFFRAAGGTDHRVVLAGKNIIQLGGNALAQHGAGVACVDDQHLLPGNLVKDGAQHVRGDRRFPLTVGEQQRHLCGGHAFFPYAVGGEVEIAHIVVIRSGEGIQDGGCQVARGGQSIRVAEDHIEVHGAAGEGLRHSQYIIGGGRRGVRLAEEAVAAYQQRAVDAIIAHRLGDVDVFLRRSKTGQAEPQRNQRTQCTAHHSAHPLSMFLLSVFYT